MLLGPEKYAAAVRLALVLVAVFWSRAEGQRPDSVYVLLARVCANEDSRPLRPASDGGTDGKPSPDCLAIKQTVTAWARWRNTTAERAIRALAPHVTRTRPARSARHIAYGSLPARGSARPGAWSEATFGAWSVHGPRWVLLRDAVATLPGDVRQCDGDPIAWGNREDEAIAIARGLVKLDCGDVVNSFWALPDKE